MSFKKILKEKRPTLSESSITTYNSILTNLYKRVFKDKDLDYKDFDETDKVLDFLKEVPCNKRKTILSALVVISNEGAYRKIMLEDITENNHNTSKQQKNEKQVENSLTSNEIQDVYTTLKEHANIIYKKKSYSIKDIQDIQDFVIVSLLGGMFIVPRRSLDYTEFKIKNVDKEKDNYLSGNELVYNKYKTSKFYNEQRLACPKELKSILNKFIKINDTDYLLHDINGAKLTSVKLNQRLNRIFKKQASVNSLRHAYLSNKYASSIEENKNISDDLSAMGSSMSQASTYIQK